MTALRSKDIFSPEEVQFAIVETTGSVSVMKKQGTETPTRDDMCISTECSDPPMLIVSDGKMLEHSGKVFNIRQRNVENFLNSISRNIEDVLLMAVDASGNCYIAWKNGDKPFTGRMKV